MPYRPEWFPFKSALTTQSLENVWRKILRHSFNLVCVWHEGTNFTPANLDGVTILIRSCKPADDRFV